LPITVSTETSIIQYLVFASDEIFSKSVPILITGGSCSSAILRMELADSRNADDWKKHFECLGNNGIEAIYLVSDEVPASAQAMLRLMNDKLRQSDTYHGIAHNVGSWVVALKQPAYATIEKEYECARKLKSAKSKDVQEKRQADYTHAIDFAEKSDYALR